MAGDKLNLHLRYFCDVAQASGVVVILRPSAFETCKGGGRHSYAVLLDLSAVSYGMRGKTDCQVEYYLTEREVIASMRHSG